MGRQPGDVWTIQASELPEVKRDDFSMHQLPTSNLLGELHSLAGVQVMCIVAQAAGIPPEVQPGLSRPVELAVERAAEMILHECRGADNG
jgi:coenzyme F420 hydrogenase subunit delta